MGIDLLEIGVKMRKWIIFTVRGCYRSVCNHPFLVGMLCFLIFLYRSSPFIFSLLVSASPVLVCTAVLLGTLLSFGQPNIPEIEIEEKTTHEAVSLKTGVSGDANATVVEKMESYYVERYSESKRDEPERANSSSGKEISKEDGLDDTAPLIEERSREVALETGDLRYEHKTEWNEERFSDGEVVENKYASVPNVDDDEQHLELDDDDDEKAETDSFDSERVNVDSLDSPPRSPWKRIEEREEEAEDDGSDSESDRAESSSPDASMADIMPMLDELHPLLDEDAPQPVHMSRDGSPRSRSDGHDELDDGSENHEDLEVDNDDNEDEEDVEGDKEEPTKSPITWTEEDQKNLMDLGSSEIERNIRLENLIMRRRARKNMSMIPERNLIDLESSDLPFNMAPITTRRQNPFDTPHDSYDDDSGLPPIPGSAPSILLARRNPFDIPYDSSEEKPDLMGDGFQEEFTRNQSRESFFRRHESFNIRPSVFAPNRRDVKMRPYFVPEGTVSEESSYSQFQRQSSELSEYSKVSSVPETESIGSVEDLEDRKHGEEHNQQELEAGPEMKGESEVGPAQDSELISREVIEEEEDSSELGQVERQNVVAFQLGDVSDHFQQENEARPIEVQNSGYSRDSSSSSLSEVSERVFTVTEGEEDLSVMEERRDFVAEEPEISAQTSVESIERSMASTSVNEIPHREPVYDLSPRELRKNFSSSSISSDVLAESDLWTVSFTERESELSILDPVDEHESGPLDVKSSVGSLVEENLVQQHVRDQVPSSSSDEDIHTLIQFSEDENRDQTQEEANLVSRESDTLIQVNEPLFEDQLTAKRSVDINETVQSLDNAIHEPSFKHLDEVQVSNTPIEPSEDVGTQKSNMSEIQELDHDISSNVSSPLSPDFISVPSTSFETITSHVDAQTIVEEVDEIKEIDEGLLSELDSVGDFSIISGSNVFEKRIDSVEVNIIENQMHTENFEEDVNWKISENETLSKESEARPAYSVVSDNYEDPSSGMREVEARTLEEIDLVFKQISDEEIEKPVFLEPPQSELASVTGSTHNTSILEFRSIEDDSSELHVEEPFPEEITYLPPEKVVDGEAEEEVKPSFEDVSLEIKADEEISAIAAEKTEEAAEAQETSSELLVSNESTNLPLEEVIVGNTEDHVKPKSDDALVEIKKDEGISDVASERAELRVEEQVKEPVSKESTSLPLEEVVDGNTEDPVKPNSDDASDEIKKDREISEVASEQTKLKVEAQLTSSELCVEEPVSNEITNLPPEEVVAGDPEDQVKPNSDDASEEIKKDREISEVASEQAELKVETQLTSSELCMEVPVSNEITNLPPEVVVDGDTENQVKSSSDDASVQIKKDREISEVASEQAELKVETEGNSSELFVTEPISKESTNLLPEEVIDGDTEDQVKPNFDDASVETNKDREISAVAFKHPELKVEAEGTSSELHVEEPVYKESTNLPPEEVVEQVKPNFEDVSVEIKKDEEISGVASEKPEDKVEAQGTSSELHVVEPVLRESTNLSPEEFIDSNTEKMVKPNSDDATLEIKKDKEMSAIAAEKPKQKVEAPADLHSASSIKGKGKLSKSSSSSSSSESSSDSDQE